MTRLVWLSLTPALLSAHMISMSTGDITIHANRAHYELRMPIYEIAHVKDPDRSLFEHVRFSTAGQPAKMVQKTCRPEPSQAAYTCSADFEFALPVERLEIECTLHSVTVPNHVHLLRAERDGKRDQALFDFSFSKGVLRFDPPTALETALTQTGAGALRALGGLVQILFLASLVLAARGRRELVFIVAMFLAGQISSALLVPFTGWQPAARFVEAAAALTIAYLAVEILLLPGAGQRWLIAGVLGIFHGLYLELFLRTTEYKPVYVLSGAALAEVLLVALLAAIFPRINHLAGRLRPVQVCASLLFVAGMVWFFLRLKG